MTAEDKEQIIAEHSSQAHIIEVLPTDIDIEKMVDEKSQELTAYWISGYWVEASVVEEMIRTLRTEILTSATR